MPSTAVADIIIGNVKGVLQCTCTEASSTSHSDHYGCAFTRSMSNKTKKTKPLNDVTLSLYTTPDEFKKAQEEDITLKPCFDKVRDNISYENGISFVISDGVCVVSHTFFKI